MLLKAFADKHYFYIKILKCAVNSSEQFACLKNMSMLQEMLLIVVSCLG